MGDRVVVVAVFEATLVFLLVFSVTIKLLKMPVGVQYEKVLVPLATFLPLCLLMAFVHELGHVFWGTIVGGTVTYMQVAYLEIYPLLRITSHFVPGVVRIQGIEGPQYGLFLVGGSMTTSLAAWGLALLFYTRKFGVKTQLLLKLLWAVGLLDLPFYVLLPQIGLRHWIVIGGDQPEPLLGARMLGIPDSLFYFFVVFTTLGVILLAWKPLRTKLQGLLSRVSEPTQQTRS